ncbi:MAG: filamentous hemagglutinin N-terminal domain-containing protein, partial [Sedimentisphaerales bacterium]|nr:filamentous hemagglutinin N-terminal domain-containing protein [Sedimentisphaerales bacterium]
MEKLRKVIKKYYLRQIMTYWLVCWMLFGLPAQVAMALPSGGVVSGEAGGANITNPNASTTQIEVLTGQTIIDWAGFDTLSDEVVNFLQAQGLSNSAVLNRILSGSPTSFYGKLNGQDMRIFIINPAGILFGQGSQVNVTQLVASTLQMNHEDFLAGNMIFQGGLSGIITNNGTINATDSAYLIGGDVVLGSTGTINAPETVLVATIGNTVTITRPDSNVLVEFESIAPLEMLTTSGPTMGSGDIWSAALIEARDITAKAENDITLFAGSQTLATATAGSDAVAEIDIIAGGNVTVKNSVVSAEATGNGVDNAIATVNIEADGKAEIISNDGGLTTVKAVADDGVNNTATVNITAVGDAKILGPDGVEVYAEASNGEDNSADVAINAGGDVSIKAVNGDVTVKAIADSGQLDGVINDADVRITGANINVLSENAGGWGYDWPDDAIVKAYAAEGATNTANVSLTATGTEVVGEDEVLTIEGGDITIESVGEKGDNVLVKAEAKNGTDNTAGIDMTAAKNVRIAADGMWDEVLVVAKAWNDIDLMPEITYETVEITPAVINEETQEVITPAVTEEVPVPVDLAVEGLTNTATVDISAGGNVNIESSGGAETAVEALAFNDIMVDIENPDGEAVVNLTMADLENNASVTINADGEGIYVSANGTNSIAGISAEAYNELEIHQQTGGKYWVSTGPWPWQGHWENLPAYAAELNMNVRNLSNNASIGMTAETGDVEIGSDEFWSGTEAMVSADTFNDFILDLYTENEVTPAASVTLDGLTNNSAVSVDAGEDVIVMAECFGDSSDAFIVADAWNDVPEPDEAGIVDNTSTVDIAAGQDVKVMAFDGGYARISAITSVGVDNTSNVTVNTEDGDVLVLAKGGSEAEILAQAIEGDDNVATTVVNAVGGDVKVIAEGEWVWDWYGWHLEDSSALIGADAGQADNSNTADVRITATAATSEWTYEGDGKVYNEVKGGDVKVIAKEGGNAEILASAEDADPAFEFITLVEEEGSELVYNPTSNTANVSIRTVSAEGTEPGELLQEAVYEGEELIEPAVYEEVAYTSGGNLEVKAENGGHAAIEAEAVYALDNTAAVDIDADGNVLVMDEGYQYGPPARTAEIIARAGEAYNSNNADVLINAENVLVIAKNHGTALIEADAYGISNPYVQYEGIPEPDGTQNNAGVEIRTHASDVDDSSFVYEYLQVMLDEAEYENPQLDAFIDGLFSGGHVLVAGIGGNAQIDALAYSGTPATANTSDVLICADGGLLVGALNMGGCYANAEIKAMSGSECSIAYSNTADLGIGAKLGLGVMAAGNNAYASIASEAVEGYMNQADLVACTEGIAAVLGVFGGSAEIASRATDGTFGSAYTGICAGEDVLVAAYEGQAFISSQAEGAPLKRPEPEPEPTPDITDLQQEIDVVQIPEYPTTADATTVVYSKRGVIAVADYDSYGKSSAGITSEASDAEINSALTGVVAGSELTPGEVFSDDPPTTLLSSLLYDLGEMYEFDVSEYFTPGSVYVLGLGSNGHASIISEATNGLANNAETVVAAPGKVMVLADEYGMPIAQIKSKAGWGGDDYYHINTAKTRIYATDVDVQVPGMYRGNAIWAY